MWVQIVPEYNQMCGLGILKNFRHLPPSYPDGTWCKAQNLKKLDKFKAGTGFVMAGFTSTLDCQETYEILRKKWPIVFQSEVRRNKRTNRKFFFVVFDSNGKV